MVSRLATWNNFDPGMKLLVHSQTSRVQPLMYGNGLVIPSPILLGMWLLIHAGIKVNPCQLKGLCKQHRNASQRIYLSQEQSPRLIDPSFSIAVYMRQWSGSSFHIYNGLSHVRHQPSIYTHNDFLWITQEIYVKLSNCPIFMDQKLVLEIIVCNFGAILSSREIS